MSRGNFTENLSERANPLHMKTPCPRSVIKIFPPHKSPEMEQIEAFIIIILSRFILLFLAERVPKKSQILNQKHDLPRVDVIYHFLHNDRAWPALTYSPLHRTITDCSQSQCQIK